MLDVPPVVAERLLPDDMWELMESYLPPIKKRPQGGGRRRKDDRAIAVGVIWYVLSDTGMRNAAEKTGVGFNAVYRRFTEFTDAGMWQGLAEHAHKAQDPAWVTCVAQAALAQVEWNQLEQARLMRERRASKSRA